MNRYCLALPYSSLATELPHGFALDQTELLPQYILEVLPPVTYPRMLRPSKLPQLTCISAAPVRQVIRRFQPVSGFPYVERSAGSTDAHTVMLSLHSAQNDPSAWEHADSFVRPL